MVFDFFATFPENVGGADPIAPPPAIVRNFAPSSRPGDDISKPAYRTFSESVNWGRIVLTPCHKEPTPCQEFPVVWLSVWLR